MLVLSGGFGSIWFQHERVSGLLVLLMFASLYVLGFEISHSRVCVLGFGSSASLVLGVGCVGGKGVLKSLFSVCPTVYHILCTQCSKQCQCYQFGVIDNGEFHLLCFALNEILG